MTAFILRGVCALFGVLFDLFGIFYTSQTRIPTNMATSKFRSCFFRVVEKMKCILLALLATSFVKIPAAHIVYYCLFGEKIEQWEYWRISIFWGYLISYVAMFSSSVIHARQVYLKWKRLNRCHLLELDNIVTWMDCFTITGGLALGSILSMFAYFTIDVTKVGGIFVLQVESYIFLVVLVPHAMVFIALLVLFLLYYWKLFKGPEWSSSSGRKKGQICIGAVMIIPSLFICIIDMWGIYLKGQNEILDVVFTCTSVLMPVANSMFSFSVSIETYLKTRKLFCRRGHLFAVPV